MLQDILEKEASAVARSRENCWQSARDDGANRIRDMRRYGRRLNSVADARLRQMLKRQLSQFIGGFTDDYPDGQN